MTNAYEIIPSGPVSGRLAAPASKSVTNRLLVLAALADGVSVLQHPLRSDDTEAMAAAVGGFGAAVEDAGGEWRVAGTAGRLSSPPEPVDARLSGTVLRFVTALAALAPSGAEVTGSPPLLRRPVAPLTKALTSLGAAVEDHAGNPPVRVEGGGLSGGAVTVDAATSSQFVSAVLLVAPYAAEEVTVTAQGTTASGYIDLTVEMMRAWGADVQAAGTARWRVAAGQGYRGGTVAVEYDASAAAHLLAVAAATGGPVTVLNAEPDSTQPDAGLTAVLQERGAEVQADGPALTVTGPERLRAVDADLGAMPDQVTTVAALAALADGTSHLRGVAVARGHETDRLAALAAELGKAGVGVDEQRDGLVIRGATARGPARLDTYSDHRLAMAFAALGARVPGIVVEDPGCVAKTYPRFWQDLATLGVEVRPR
jgi:3-phosphoshikimate 1-carboxyvinyltransferase